MLLITGRLDRIITREAGTPGNTWTETTLAVQDWGQTLYVTTGRDFGELPEQGEAVALNVLVRTYVSKSGNAGHGFVATGRNDQAERALLALASVPSSGV